VFPLPVFGPPAIDGFATTAMADRNSIGEK